MIPMADLYGRFKSPLAPNILTIKPQLPKYYIRVGITFLSYSQLKFYYLDVELHMHCSE